MKLRAVIYSSTLLGLCCLGHAQHANATTVGLSPTTSNAYGIWDIFAANTFTSRAADSGSGLTGGMLSLSSGGIVLGGNDRLYLNAAASTWAVSGSTSYAIKSITLQLKNYSYTTESLASFFSASLAIGTSNIAPDTTSLTTLTEGSVTDEILTWTWSASLAANTNSAFAVNFASTSGAHISVDGFDVNANPNAVPEPSTVVFGVLGGVGLIGGGWRRRRVGRGQAARAVV